MKKKVGLYDPYLDTLGGGERHILSILKALNEEGYDPVIFWDKDLSKNIVERFNIKLRNLKFEKNIFGSAHVLEKIKNLSGFDIFFYITDGSYFLSSARKNFVFVMVPRRKLVNLNLANRLKLLNWRFIVNSRFTQKFLKNWGIKSEVLYHYIDQNFLSTKSPKKKKVILTVGRFFTHLHAKKHDLIIDIFKKNKNKLPGFKLILAGGLRPSDHRYFKRLKELAGNDKSIEFKPNLSYKKLVELYKSSLLYWHFAGFGIDEDKNPHLVEHFGITPLEAMSAGCMTFVYRAGGPKELIHDGKNGFLFSSEGELINKTLKIVNSSILQDKVRQNAKQFIANKFSYEAFKNKVREILL